MKKLLLLIMIGGFFNSCNKTTEYKTTNDGRKVEVFDANSFCSPYVKYIEFDGHEYVSLVDGYRGSLCHSPKCHCLENYKTK